MVTGCSGLIGSEAVRFFARQGFDVVGIDNNMRKQFFGENACTLWNLERLKKTVNNFEHRNLDIRNGDGIKTLFKEFADDIKVIIHTAAQPSHDWAASDPETDFSVNANGTLILLEATRKHCPDASFIFTSTNKVYGDLPNHLPLVELESRWEIDQKHPYFGHGIPESFSVDQSTHSLFGVSKVAADLMVQEYGSYFGLNTACFRGGCLTGPAHSGTKLHGFLSYLVKCAVNGDAYTIFGYKGKQVRDNIHSEDLIQMFWEYHQDPIPAGVFNAGGGRANNCSVLEAISIIEEVVNKPLNYSISEENRIGDHIWYVSDTTKFEEAYPNWQQNHTLRSTIEQIVDAQINPVKIG